MRVDNTVKLLKLISGFYYGNINVICDGCDGLLYVSACGKALGYRGYVSIHTPISRLFYK
jgi:hypothetical protein